MHDIRMPLALPLLLLVLLVLPARAASAQQLDPASSPDGPADQPQAVDQGERPPSGEKGDEDEAQAPHQGWWNGALGASGPEGVYLGLWTLHLRRAEDGISSHHLIGVGWNGIYGKTFVNSFGDRTWGIGVHRSMVSLDNERTSLDLGVRVGILHGYDERMHPVAGSLPVLPAAEVVATSSLGPVGVQATWAALVTSVGAYIPLGS